MELLRPLFKSREAKNPEKEKEVALFFSQQEKVFLDAWSELLGDNKNSRDIKFVTKSGNLLKPKGKVYDIRSFGNRLRKVRCVWVSSTHHKNPSELYDATSVDFDKNQKIKRLATNRISARLAKLIADPLGTLPTRDVIKNLKETEYENFADSFKASLKENPSIGALLGLTVLSIEVTPPKYSKDYMGRTEVKINSLTFMGGTEYPSQPINLPRRALIGNNGTLQGGMKGLAGLDPYKLTSVIFDEAFKDFGTSVKNTINYTNNSTNSLRQAFAGDAVSIAVKEV